MLIVAAVVGTAATALADDIVVLPPVGDAKATPPIASALAKANVGTLAAKPVDATCAGDPGCLIKTGEELSANRIVSLTVAADGKLDVLVVDVGAKLMLGTRSLTIAPKKLAKELGPSLARLVEDVTVDKAKSLFAEGNEHYNLGEFTQALERYKLAYRVKALPAFQFNIAQCHRKLGQHKEAIAMYQAYLVGVPAASNKAMVDSLIAESQKEIDKQAAFAAQTEHDKFTTEQKKAEEARKAKEAEAAASSERSKAEQARIAAEQERERSYNRHPSRKWMLVTGALGVATAGVGTYFGIQARNAQSSFDTNMCGDAGTPRIQTIIDQCSADRDRGQRDALLGNVLIGSGAAVVLVSAIVFAIDPGNIERPSQQRVGLAISPSSVKVVFQW